MTAVYGGVYRKLKDRRTPVSDKLKLAKYGWVTDSVYLPNKEQVIIDLITGLIVNKKRLKLSEAEVSDVWSCLSQLLKSPRAHGTLHTGQTVSIKPSFCQAVCEVLQSWDGKSVEGTPVTFALSCCHSVVDSTTLRDVFTSRYDSLVALYSATVTVAAYLCISDSPEASQTVNIVEKLTTHFRRAQSSSANQKQVLQWAGDKLLYPVSTLLYLLTDRPEKALLPKLRDILSQAFFHRDHIEMYSLYLVKSDKIKSAHPKHLETLFSQLKSGVEGKAKFLSLPTDLIQQAVTKYLPVFYQSFVMDSSYLRSTKHTLLERLTDVLTLRLIPQVRSGSDLRQHVTCLGEMLRVTHTYDVYNVAKDNVEGGQTLAFYRGILDALLEQRPSTPLFDCLVSLLQLNHAILEPKVKAILGLCWLVDSEFDHDERSRRDDFLCDMVRTYVQLRQLHRWVEKVLSQLFSTSDHPAHAECPPRLMETFALHVQALTPGVMLSIWTLFVGDITGNYLTSLSTGSKQVSNFCVVAQLFSVFLRNVRVAEQTVTDLTLDKVHQQMTALEEALGQLTTLIMTENKHVGLVHSVLQLCHSWGEVSMLIKSRENSPGDSPSSGASSPLDFSLVHPYLSSDHWCQLSQQINKRGETKCLYMLYMFQVQKLRALSVCLDDPGSNISVQSVLEHLLTLQTPPSNLPAWDGDPLSLTKDSLPVAQWSLIVSYLPLLTPVLSDSQSMELASYIVHTVGNDPETSTVHSDLLSLSSLSRQLLKSPHLHEQSQLMSANLTCVWAGVKGQVSATEVKSKKRKKVESSQNLMKQVFETLSDEKTDWCAVDVSNDSEWTDHLEGLSTCLNQLLSSSTSLNWTPGEALINYVQVLGELPVEYIRTGEQLRCLCGLFSLLVSSTTHSPSSPPLTLLTCITHLISVILDSQSRCPFLYLVDTHKLFDWSEKFVGWLQSQENPCADLKAEGWRVVHLMTRGVVRDLHLVRHLQDYVTSVQDRVAKITTFKTDRDQFPDTSPLLLLITQIFDEIPKVLRRRSSQKEELQTACCECVESLAEPCLRLMELTCQRKPGGSHLAALFRCYTALAPLISGTRPLSEAFPNDKQLQQLAAQACDNLIGCSLRCIKSSQIIALRPALGFITTICHSDIKLSSCMTIELRRELWESLCALLIMQLKVVHKSESAPDNRTSRDLCSSHSRQSTEGDFTLDAYKEDENTITDAISAALATLLSTCDQEEFPPLMKSVTQNCHRRHLQSEPWRVRCSILIWDHLLTCDLSEDHMTTFCQAVFETLVQCQSLLEEVRWWRDGQVYTGVIIPVLQLETRMLQFGQVLMSAQTAVVCLHGCQYDLLHGCPDRLYGQLFSSIYSVLNAYLLHHTEAMYTTVPSVIGAAKLLMRSVIQRGDQERAPQGETTLTGSYITDLVNCAHELDRLFSLLSSHKVELAKVAPYIVSEYVTEVQQVTLLPVLKKALVPAIYKLLDICDLHSIALLYTVLSPGVTQIFKLLHEEYSKHYKYTGRV